MLDSVPLHPAVPGLWLFSAATSQFERGTGEGHRCLGRASTAPSADSGTENREPASGACVIGPRGASDTSDLVANQGVVSI